MKTTLKRVDRGWQHGKVWEYRLSVFGKQIVPFGRYASLWEVLINTWWWLRKPSKWR